MSELSLKSKKDSDLNFQKEVSKFTIMNDNKLNSNILNSDTKNDIKNDFNYNELSNSQILEYFKSFRLNDELHIEKIKSKLNNNSDKLNYLNDIIMQDKKIIKILDENYNVIGSKFEEIKNILNKLENISKSINDSSLIYKIKDSNLDFTSIEDLDERLKCEQEKRNRSSMKLINFEKMIFDINEKETVNLNKIFNLNNETSKSSNNNNNNEKVFTNNLKINTNRSSDIIFKSIISKNKSKINKLKQESKLLLKDIEKINESIKKDKELITSLKQEQIVSLNKIETSAIQELINSNNTSLKYNYQKIILKLLFILYFSKEIDNSDTNFILNMEIKTHRNKSYEKSITKQNTSVNLRYQNNYDDNDSIEAKENQNANQNDLNYNSNDNQNNNEISEIKNYPDNDEITIIDNNFMNIYKTDSNNNNSIEDSITFDRDLTNENNENILFEKYINRLIISDFSRFIDILTNDLPDAWNTSQLREISQILENNKIEADLTSSKTYIYQKFFYPIIKSLKNSIYIKITRLRLEKLINRIEDGKNKLEDITIDINDLVNRNNQFTNLIDKIKNKSADIRNVELDSENINNTEIICKGLDIKQNENQTDNVNSIKNNYTDIKEVHNDVIENLFKEKKELTSELGRIKDIKDSNKYFIKCQTLKENNQNIEIESTKTLLKLNSKQDRINTEDAIKIENKIHKKAISALDIRTNLLNYDLNNEFITTLPVYSDYTVTKKNEENGIKKAVLDSLNILKLNHNDIEYNYCYLVKALSKILLKPKDIVLIKYK